MYTTRQAAELLGYASDAVIRLMIIKKKIKAEKFGHVWMIDKKELDKIKR